MDPRVANMLLEEKLAAFRGAIGMLNNKCVRLRSRIKQLERYSGAGYAEHIDELTKLNKGLFRNLRTAVRERDAAKGLPVDEAIDGTG